MGTCYTYIIHVHDVQATRVARENLEKVIKRGDNLNDLHDRAGTSCFCDACSLWKGNNQFWEFKSYM